MPQVRAFSTKSPDQQRWPRLLDTNYFCEQKGKARIVFDSTSRTEGPCINDKLCNGPGRNHLLRGVVLGFHQHPYVVTDNVENMFHEFVVPDEHKTYLKFFLHENNDPICPLIECWSIVQLMGLKSSPAIANTGVQFAACDQRKMTTNGLGKTISWIGTISNQQKYRPNRETPSGRVLCRWFTRLTTNGRRNPWHHPNCYSQNSEVGSKSLQSSILRGTSSQFFPPTESLPEFINHK